MYRNVKRIIKRCDLCQKTKVNNQLARGPMKSNIPNRPLEIVSIDLMGPLPREQRGAQFILAIIDVFSKYIKIYALNKATTKNILRKLLNDYIPSVGKIQRIISDNGTQFRSKQWTETLANENINQFYV